MMRNLSYNFQNLKMRKESAGNRPFIERWQWSGIGARFNSYFSAHYVEISPPLFLSGHHRATKISHSNQSRTSDFFPPLSFPSPAAKTLIKRTPRWPPRMRWIWTAQKAAAQRTATTITTVKIVIYRSMHRLQSQSLWRKDNYALFLPNYYTVAHPLFCYISLNVFVEIPRLVGWHCGYLLLKQALATHKELRVHKT